ncbi:hypothetical protein EDD15DRAFT_2468421, partial [Pisolithus albus]
SRFLVIGSRQVVAACLFHRLFRIIFLRPSHQHVVLCERMFYPPTSAPLASTASPEQGSLDLVMDGPLGATDTMGSLGGDVPPRRSELYAAMSGYDNDQREWKVSYEPLHRPPLEYEAATQPNQGYLQFCGVGRFPVVPSPTFAVHPDALVSLTNADETRTVDQHLRCGLMDNSATYAQNSLTVGVTASPTHSHYRFNPPPHRYYHSSAAAPSSYMHHGPFDAPPRPPASSAVPGNSESSTSYHSSPVHTGGGPPCPTTLDNGPFATNRDAHPVHNPTSEPFFYQCYFDNCQEWISDNPKQMRDHFQLHGVHLGIDPHLPIRCRWVGCTREIKKKNFRRHILGHLGKRLGCSACKTSYSRSDSLFTHFKESAECLNGTRIELVSPKAHRRQVFGDRVVWVKVLGD